MPNVKEGESKSDYMDRCMGDSKMVDEFGNPSQRAAVCNSYFEDKKGLNAKAGMEDYIFSTPEGARKKSMQIGFKGEIHSDKMADGTMMYFPARTEEEFQKWFDKNDSHDASYDEEKVEAAEYQGKKVTLNKPFRTQGGPKKFAVYVQNESGRVVIVRFGDPNMEIKRDDPQRRKNFRSRHNCDSPGPRTKARYWSCRQWESGRKVEAEDGTTYDAKRAWLFYDEWMENEGEVIEGIEEVIEAEESGSCCDSCAENAEAKMIRKDVFDNPGEATSRAKELGLEGIHSHKEGDTTVFMPGKTHEEYEKKTGEKLASYHDEEEKEASYHKEKMSASQCGIGEEFIDGECRVINVYMDLEIASATSLVEASTGKTYIQIKGIAFHEGMNKNKWSLTRNGAEKVLPQMVGADLTLNHPKAKHVGFERNMDGGVNEAVVGRVIEATIDDDKKDGTYNVRYVANVERQELFEALESGLWMRPGYGVSIGGYGVPVQADDNGLVFDDDFTFDHLAIVHKPAYNRANIEEMKKVQVESASEENAEAVQYGKPGKNDPRKTPAKPSERRKGSKKNPPGSAKKPNKSIEVSEATRTTIRNKMTEHNKKDKGSKASMGALLTVFRRGAGAFSTSHAPNMSRNGWGIARVNAFLYLLRNGRPSNPNYKQDNDLLPKGHPRASRSASVDETFIAQTSNGIEQPKEVNIMSEEEMTIEQSDVIANEMEALKAELILAQATIEDYKAQEAAKAEESRLALVQKASEIGLKGHEDLTEDTLTSLIASWEDARPSPEPAEMKPVEPAVASEISETPSPASTKVVANYLNGRKVETEEEVYARAFNAWASAWNRTLSGVEASEGRFKAPKYEDIKEMI